MELSAEAEHPEGPRVLAPPIGATVEFVVAKIVGADENTTSTQKDMLSRSRIDVTINFVLPFSRAVELYLSGRWIRLLGTDPGEDRTHNLQQIGLRYFTNEERSSSVELVYNRGSLPPEFVADQTISAGWSIHY